MKKTFVLILGIVAVMGVIGCAGGAKKGDADNAAKSDMKSTKSDKKMKANTMAASGETIWSKTCKYGDDTRMIAVNKAGNGCTVKYTKLENTSTPANSKRGTQYCEGVANRIFENLKNAGFECT